MLRAAKVRDGECRVILSDHLFEGRRVCGLGPCVPAKDRDRRAVCHGGLDDSQCAAIQRVDLVAVRVERFVWRDREQEVVRRCALVLAGEDTLLAPDGRRDGHVEAAGFEVLLTAECQAGDSATEHGLAHDA